MPPDLDPAKDIYPLEETMEHLRRQVGPVLKNVQEVSDRLTKLKEYQKNLELLAPAGQPPRGPGRSPVGVSGPGVAAQ